MRCDAHVHVHVHLMSLSPSLSPRQPLLLAASLACQVGMDVPSGPWLHLATPFPPPCPQAMEQQSISISKAGIVTQLQVGEGAQRAALQCRLPSARPLSSATSPLSCCPPPPWPLLTGALLGHCRRHPCGRPLRPLTHLR